MNPNESKTTALFGGRLCGGASTFAATVGFTNGVASYATNTTMPFTIKPGWRLVGTGITGTSYAW